MREVLSVMRTRLNAFGVVLGLCCWTLGVATVSEAFAAHEPRAFELVSRPSLGADVEAGGSARAAARGGAVAYQSFGTLPGAPARGLFNQFRSARTPGTGWTTSGVTTPLDSYSSFSPAHHLEAISPDVTAGLGSGWGSQDAGHPQMLNLWRWDANGSFALVSSPSIPVAPEDPQSPTFGSHFAGGSDDLRVVIFDSSRALTADAPADPGDYLYQWSGGDLELVSVLPGDVVTTGATVGYGRAEPVNGPLYPGEHAVSSDGSRVFFSVPENAADPAREVYLRENAASVLVSESERTVPDPVGTAALFQLASEDGSSAFFASPRKLTDDATAAVPGGVGATLGNDFCAFTRCDLYRWSANALQGHHLTDLTTADGGGAGVVATVGASDDAARVYFVATGVLVLGGVGDEPNPVAGEPNLYLWEEGRGIRLVTTLDGSPDADTGLAADLGVWDHQLSAAPGFRDARVTPDGRYLAFQSRRALTEYDTAGHRQLYRFDAVTGSLDCVSCNRRVGASTGDAFLKRHRPSDFLVPWLSRNVSESGDVVFDSTEPLVPEDTNGRIDVYEWSDGAVHLISSGQDNDDSAFLDASEDGVDVFFITRARLVGSDTDSFLDAYDARVGGGFAEAPRTPPPCSGESCRGPISSPPIRIAAGSAGLQGHGNAKPRRASSRKTACKRGHVRKRVRGKARCVKKPGKRRGHRSGRR